MRAIILGKLLTLTITVQCKDQVVLVANYVKAIKITVDGPRLPRSNHRGMFFYYKIYVFELSTCCIDNNIVRNKNENNLKFITITRCIFVFQHSVFFFQFCAIFKRKKKTIVSLPRNTFYSHNFRLKLWS